MFGSDEEGHADFLSELLAQGADVNAKDNDKRTALDAATDNKYKEVVQLLKKMAP